MKKYDTIVIGLGCVGSSTIYELSKNNDNVLGIEQFDAPNDMGSSHGSSRIMRLSYHEGEKYIPLLYRAIEKWNNLQNRSNDKLFYNTGSLTIGHPDAEKYKQSKKACDEFDIEYTQLDSDELAKKYPAWNIPEHFKAFIQPDGGVLDNEKCMQTQIYQAKQNGAEINTNEKVIDWKRESDKIIIKTESDTYITNSLVISSGPWVKSHLDKVSSLIEIERHVICNYNMQNQELFEKYRYPPWIMDTGDKKLYGLPMHRNNAIKIGDMTDYNTVNNMEYFERTISNSEIKPTMDFCNRYINSDINHIESSLACPLSHTPDGDFIIDEIEDDIYIGIGLSGHGFKLSNVIGEILNGLVHNDIPDYNIEPFKISRFDI